MRWPTGLSCRRAAARPLRQHSCPQNIRGKVRRLRVPLISVASNLPILPGVLAGGGLTSGAWPGTLVIAGAKTLYRGHVLIVAYCRCRYLPRIWTLRGTSLTLLCLQFMVL